MSEFNHIGHEYVKRNFTERRQGHDKHTGGQPPKGGSTGGLRAPGKPRNPKPYLPMANKIERA